MPKGIYQTDKHRGRPKGATDKQKRYVSPSILGKGNNHGGYAEFTEQMAFRCSPEQRQRLEAYAQRHGFDISEVLRRCIDRL